MTQPKHKNHKTGRLKLKRLGRRKPQAALVAVLVSGVGAYLIISSLGAATPATLSLSPATSNVGLGSTFTVTVHENSSTAETNAVQTNLTYPTAKLQYISTDFSSGPFSTTASSTGGSGAVNFTVAYLGSFRNGTISQSGTAITGSGTSWDSTIVGKTILYSDGSTATITAFTDATHATSSVSKTVAAGSSYVMKPLLGDQTVAIITFKAVGVGSAPISFGCIDDTFVNGSKNASPTCTNGDVVAGTAANSNLLAGGSQTGGTYTVVDNTAPTVPGGLTAGTSTVTSNAFTWTASTDDVGVTSYKVFRNGTQVGTSATPSYTDNGLQPNTSYTYTVSASDAAGNTSAQSVGLTMKTPPDTTAPTVPGGTISQTSRTMTSMVIGGWTQPSDNVGVTGYKIFRNGTQVGTSATTSFSDTGLAPGTTYTYTVAAFDAAGNTSAQTSPGVALATAPDTVAPTTIITSPATGATLSGSNLVTATATDNVGVTKVEFYVDGVLKATDTTSPYNFTWDTTAVANGSSHTLTTKAYDAASNVGTSSAVSVGVNNLLGDINGDGHVNIFDLSTFLTHWMETGAGIPEDFNNDGIVNVFDLSTLLGNYGK